MKFSMLKIKIIPDQGRAQDPARQSTSGFRQGGRGHKLVALHFAWVWMIENPVQLLHRAGHLEYRQIHGNHQPANGYP